MPLGSKPKAISVCCPTTIRESASRQAWFGEWNFTGLSHAGTGPPAAAGDRGAGDQFAAARKPSGIAIADGGTFSLAAAGLMHPRSETGRSLGCTLSARIRRTAAHRFRGAAPSRAVAVRTHAPSCTPPRIVELQEKSGAPGETRTPDLGAA